jgi:phosphohistidine phosphatase SixA
MIRRLIVLRHAKSDWDSNASSDHERPLNARGRRDSPRIGRRIAELGWTPDVVLASDAVRTAETWRRMADAFDEVELQLLPSFYLAGPDVVCDALAELSDAVTTAMVVGHNPGWEGLAARLSGKAVKVGTAHALLMTLDAPSWAVAAARPGQWRIAHHLRPKDL